MEGLKDLADFLKGFDIQTLISMGALYYFFIKRRFDKIDERFEKLIKKIDERFDKVDQRFQKTDDKLEAIHGRVCHLEGASEKQIYVLKEENQVRKAK